ncbi:MAG TPA: adenylate/guanylate cyclase domain-containing protein [Burkholderiales bacterium]|jgi:class 3 adenylate cyclase|nr:adenylate/guanylate cyclase domain-containing protein [Burkholderiales bacterium]
MSAAAGSQATVIGAVAHQKTTVGSVTGTGRRNAVIHCVELRGLARMSEALEPNLVLQLADEFFDFAADIVAGAHGEAISAQHDVLLSVFAKGNPLQTAQQAVRAAQRIQAEFPALGERWRKACGLRAGLAQGLHLGEVILGDAGPRGLQRRAAFGDAVSLARVMHQRARAGEIVMSDAVMGALSVENLDLDAEPLPQLELPRRSPIRIYGVLVADRLDFT